MFESALPWSCCFAILMLREWFTIPGHWWWLTRDHAPARADTDGGQSRHGLTCPSHRGEGHWLGDLIRRPIGARHARAWLRFPATRRGTANTSRALISFTIKSNQASRCLCFRCPAGDFPPARPISWLFFFFGFSCGISLRRRPSKF